MDLVKRTDLRARPSHMAPFQMLKRAVMLFRVLSSPLELPRSIRHTQLIIHILSTNKLPANIHRLRNRDVSHQTGRPDVLSKN